MLINFIMLIIKERLIIIGVPVIIILICLLILIGYRLKSIFIITKRNHLSFFREYTHYGDYSKYQRTRKESLNEILNKFKKDNNNEYLVYVESKLNNIYYAVFDLDNEEHFDLFKTLYAANSYVLFITSHDHYWGIVDIPYKKLKDVFNEHNWNICNDIKYVSFSKGIKKIIIRGLYENSNRKPYLYEINGNLSKNFQLFIDKLCI